MTVTLRPMTDAALSVRLVGQIEEYAEDLVLSGRATRQNALERSTVGHATLLPDGVRTKGHLIFDAEVEGTVVGWIWLALPGSSQVRADLAWVFNVEIDERFRGRGHGRELMLAGERELRDRGEARVGLNVFGHNPVARRLYDSLGYRLTAQQMLKPLAESPADAPRGGSGASGPSRSTSASGSSRTTEPGGSSRTAEPSGSSRTAEPSGSSRTAAPGGSSRTTEPGGSSRTAEPGVSLRPLTERELRAWLAEQADEFAKQLVDAGEATPDEAPGMVRSSVEARLPDGVATPGQLVYAGQVDGATVGRIWAALPGSGGQQRPGTAWIYDLYVDPAQRGRGYGRAIIEALERGLVARGIPRLGLNVYGHNAVASRLYDSLGFQVTSAQMVKSLA